MPDSNETPKVYGTKITTAGSAMIAACILNGTKLNITHAAAGDGGGAYYVPDRAQTALVNECWRGEIAAAEISSTEPNMIDIKVVIPGGASGFTAREIGLFSAEGTLVAICNTPDTEKASSVNGAAGKLTMIMHILVSDASVLEITINPSLDTVSREELDHDLEKKQDKLTGKPGQVPVFNDDGSLEMRDFPGADSCPLVDAAQAVAEAAAQVAANAASEAQAAQSAANSAASAASTAQSKANSAASTASTAQSTANSAKSKADSLITYGTADKTAGSSTLATGTVYLMYE